MQSEVLITIASRKQGRPAGDNLDWQEPRHLVDPNQDVKERPTVYSGLPSNTKTTCQPVGIVLGNAQKKHHKITSVVTE